MEIEFSVLEKFSFCRYKFILPDSSPSSEIHPHRGCTQASLHTNSLSHSQRSSTQTQHLLDALFCSCKFVKHTPEKTHSSSESAPGAAPSHPWPCQSSSNLATPSSWEQRGGGGGMKDVYSVRGCLYHGCRLAPSVSTYLFSFFTPQPNLERFKFDLGSETSVTALSVDNGKI